MDDIVAIKVVNSKNQKKYFLTWGRIFDRIEENRLLDIIKKNLKAFEVGSMRHISLCRSLQDASKAPFFYENLFAMSQKKIPFGKNYNKWKKAIENEISQGREIYFLG